MARFLLDTNVISETRRTRPHGGVLAWFGSVGDDDLRLPVVVVGELQAGVESVRRTDALRATTMDRWVQQVVETFTLIPMDHHVFRVWARLMDRQPSQLTLDAMIAATAEVHGLIVITRNVRDFAKFGSRTLDPFAFR